MLARIGAALDSELVTVGTPARATCGSSAARRCPAAIDVKSSQERRRRAAVRLAAQPGPHHAAQGRPHRGGQPHPRGARVIGVRPAGSTPTTTSRSCRRPQLDLAAMDADAARRTRSIIMFLGPLMHRDDALPAALRRRLRPRHPHRRAAHDRAAAVRPGGHGHRGQLPRRRSTARRRPGAADRADRARRHRHRERPAWPPPGTTASPSSATPAPTTWSRTSASSWRSSACGSRASAPRR